MIRGIAISLEVACEKQVQKIIANMKNTNKDPDKVLVKRMAVYDSVSIIVN